jgi:hypothetical protein
MMKKIMFAILIAALALGTFASVAGAQAIQTNTGLLHDYMEQALADKLGLPLATIQAQFEAGKTLYQIALDNGITQANWPAFAAEVRTTAINAALKAGAITQAQANRMLRMAIRGMGQGMMYGGGGAGAGTGNSVCDGTGVPGGKGMHQGGAWQQVNP